VLYWIGYYWHPVLVLCESTYLSEVGRSESQVLGLIAVAYKSESIVQYADWKYRKETPESCCGKDRDAIRSLLSYCEILPPYRRKP
jgi:hypothetical protein